MNKTFTVNGVVYKAKEATFNFICDMEDRGISVEDFDAKPMKLCREYVAYCAGITSEAAGTAIENHVINGGNLSEVYAALADAISESGFFQAAMNAETNKEPAKIKKKIEK